MFLALLQKAVMVARCGPVWRQEMLLFRWARLGEYVPMESVIDADGRRVAWESGAGLAGAPADGKLHVFVRDLDTHETKLVSRAR